MNKICKKIVAIMLLVAITITNMPIYVISATDTTGPSVVITGISSNTVVESGKTISFKVYFSDETAMGTVNMTSNHVALLGFTGTTSVSGTGNIRTVTISNVQDTTGDNSISIRAGAAKDAVGNKTEVITVSGFTIKKPVVVAPKDTIAPSVVVTGINSNTVVESGKTISFKVYFSDETAMGTVNMTSNHVALLGFTGTTSVSGTGNIRTVTISNVQDTTGDNSISIRAGAAKDAVGNKTEVITVSGFTIEKPVVVAPKDTTAPSVVITLPSPMTVEVGGTVTYTVVFSDETAMGNVNLNADYIYLSGFTATKSVSGEGNRKTVTLSNIQGTTGTDKKIILRAGAAVDAAGNKTEVIESSEFTLKEKTIVAPKDTTAPSVVITGINSNTVVESGKTISFKVYFSDETAMGTVNMTSNHVALLGFTGTTSVSGTGNIRTVTISNVQDTTGDNSISIRAGAAKDAVGNKTEVITVSGFTIKKPVVVAPKDTTAPSVVITLPSPMTVEVGGTVTYTVVFSDETAMGNVNLNADYIYLSGFTATKSVSGEGNRKTVTLSNIQGTTGTDKKIILRAGAAVDAAGNKTEVIESSEFTLKEKTIVTPKDKVAPVVKVESVNPTKVYANGTVKYVVTFSDNIAVTDVKLYASKITPVGFTADIAVAVNGVKSAEITLKNIKGTIGNNKYIKIASGIALDAEGNRSKEVTSIKFSIIKNSTITNTTPIKPVYTSNCIDDLELLGNINKEITYFASWLRAEKYTATYPQENNYVVEDDTMTYMVEYFNGSTAPEPDVKFELTIPYKVIVEEINGGGKITKQTDKETVITWNMGTIKSYVESKGTGFCRLYVRVKFAENKALKESKNISEVFYATLKTIANGNESYSYMRQLFIDITEGKTGTYNKYLTAIDSTNQVRPNDEITRAEFAKLLADTGIVKVEMGSKEYKTFKDYKEIPSYARDAVSALLETDIIQAFPDGTFKPNNPILMEDVMQMLAQASTYMSGQKLTVNKPVFLYTEELTGKDGDVSPKKEYIMELMRQNVISKTNAKPDTYALRKDVVGMVNSLTFRGPYVETLPENTLKFADIREDSVVFYNIVGAANSYTYTYDYRLWQQIIDIK